MKCNDALGWGRFSWMWVVHHLMSGLCEPSDYATGLNLASLLFTRYFKSVRRYNIRPSAKANYSCFPRLIHFCFWNKQNVSRMCAKRPLLPQPHRVLAPQPISPILLPILYPPSPPLATWLLHTRQVQPVCEQPVNGKCHRKQEWTFRRCSAEHETKVECATYHFHRRQITSAIWKWDNPEWLGWLHRICQEPQILMLKKFHYKNPSVKKIQYGKFLFKRNPEQ